MALDWQLAASGVVAGLPTGPGSGSVAGRAHRPVTSAGWAPVSVEFLASERIPWFLPGAMLSVAAALLLGPRLARRLKTSWAVAGLFVGSAGTILAATLTPLAGQPEVAAGSVRSCDFARMAPPPLEALLQVDDVSLNVLLFVPLGIAVGLLPVARRTIPTAGLAVVLPFAIEATQQLAPVLGRGCESADVVDNLTGLLGGGVIGVVLRAMRDIAGPPPAAEGRADGS